MPDKIIGPVLALREKSTERPPWDQISHFPSEVESYLGLWNLFCITDGILLKKVHDPVKGNTLQLVLPEKLRSDVPKSLHSDVTSGHLGVSRTSDRVQTRYFRIGMDKDITKWVKKCEQCQLTKAPQHTPRAPMQQYLVMAPIERIANDILGPLPESHSGNRYILVAADYYSKWVNAWPMPNMETIAIPNILIDRMFALWGVPLHIHTDRGTQFESQLFQNLCSALGISKTRTTAFHPQSNGMVERFNCTLEGMISKYISDYQHDWDESLPLLLLAYHSSTHESTGFSISMLFLLREPRLPIDLLMGDYPKSQGCAAPDYVMCVQNMQDKMHKVHELARDKLNEASDRQKQNYVHQRNRIDYQTGDLVLLKEQAKKKGKSKLQAQ